MTTHEMSEEIRNLYLDYRAAKETVGHYQTDAEQLKAHLMKALEAEGHDLTDLTATHDGRPAFTLKRILSTRINGPRLKKAWPAIYEEFSATGESFRLELK